MDANDLKITVLQTAQVLEQFRRLSDQAYQVQTKAAEHLQQSASAATEHLQRAAGRHLDQLSVQLGQRLDQELHQATSNLQRSLQDAATLASQNEQKALTAIRQLNRVAQRLLLASTVAFACLLVAIGGSIWLTKHYYSQIKQNQIAAELLQAYNAADVTLCDGKLCAHVEAGSRRYGDKQQYQPVKNRPD